MTKSQLCPKLCQIPLALTVLKLGAKLTFGHQTSSQISITEVARYLAWAGFTRAVCRYLCLSQRKRVCHAQPGETLPAANAVVDSVGGKFLDVIDKWRHATL